jgi:hypothetical protein
MNKETLLSTSLSLATLRAEALFFDRFAQLIASDVPLLRAIEIASEEISDLGLRNIIQSIKMYLEQGESISDAFRRYPKHFSKFAIAIIDSGEREGRLEDNFSKLAESLRREIVNRKAIPTIADIAGTASAASQSPINETMFNDLAARFAASFVDALEQLTNQTKHRHHIPAGIAKELCPKCRKILGANPTNSTKPGAKRPRKK